MDVLTLLKRDHETVGAMLDEVAKCPPDDGRMDELAHEIENALTVHAKIEEQLFYPALRDRANEGEEKVEVFEAYTEHDVIKHLIALLKKEGRRDEAFAAELRVLTDSVKHHVKEEESKIFALAKDCFDKAQLDDMGARMESLKGDLLQSTPR